MNEHVCEVFRLGFWQDGLNMLKLRVNDVSPLLDTNTSKKLSLHY
jgi:hypothetical protein